MSKQKELNKAKFLATKYAGKKITLSEHEYVIYGWHGTYSVDCLTDGKYYHNNVRSWDRISMRVYEATNDITNTTTITHVTSKGVYKKLNYALYVVVKDIEEALMSKLNLTREQLYE